MKRTCWLAMAVLLCACSGRDAQAPQTQPAPAEQAQTTQAPVRAAAPTAPATAAMPAPGTIGFAGFGPALFGADDEQVRIAWGKDLGDAKPDQPGGCYYLIPQPRTVEGYRIAFMIEGDRFVRIDVNASDIEAPGGGLVGMSTKDIEARYSGRVQAQPHKYVDGGQYLRISDEAGGPGVLVFETDENGRVTTWRIGLPPQVDYVEGCS